MLDGVGLPQVGLGLGWLVCFIFVVALIRGRLVPRSTLDDVIHDRDEWRTESRLKDAQIAEKDTQLRHMGEVARLVNDVLSAVQSAATRRSDQENP